MRSPFLKGVLAGALVAAIVTMAGTAFAGSGIGAIINLGRTNTVNRTTTLSGTTSGKLLRLTNKGTGSALGLSVKAGKPPLAVSSKARVANLNADMIDGLHASDLAGSKVFEIPRQTIAFTTDPVQLVNVPGFGIVTATLSQSSRSGIHFPTFTNTSTTVVYVWLDGDRGAPVKVLPGGTYTDEFGADADGWQFLFATSSAMERVWVWWMTNDTSWNVSGLGIMY